ncbi:hypothetical protein [Clostridium estertheticum]|uniref:hypothetical protein n=1 Tax=Clostridium estertheticum TaxID=238834 RepID=UPI001C0DF1B8|nr:hypothetical protein [Clostridium estertheticum]MBU3185631.1 hypothetical protein [Clostridium estertheticum]
MDKNLQIIIETLSELRNSSIKSTSDTIRETMKKYNMLFLGSKFNTIYSVELHHSLKTIFNIDIDIYELNKLIPTACKMLNMHFEELVSLEDLGKPNPFINYQIILW